MTGVTGIGGVFFKAEDPKALLAWYAEHLGVPVDAEGYVVFRWAEEGTTTWAPFPADTKYFGEAGARFMINYRVEDLDATLTRLREEGVEVDAETAEHEYGRFGWAHDPEGNRIELWQPAPGQ